MPSAEIPAKQWTRNPEIIDLMKLNIFLREFPHEAFAALRRDCPVYWNEEDDPEPGFWNVTKYADVVHVSKNPKIFSSAKGINIYYPQGLDMNVVGALVGNMITMDAPLHTAYRKIASPFFTMNAVRGLEPRIRELTNRILDEVAPRGECEFMSEVAARLPIAVLCDIMDVPESDHAKIFDWSNKLIGLEDREVMPSIEAAVPTFMGLFSYGQRLAKERRANPGNDLISAKANAKQGEMPIPPVLLDGFFLLMVIAGNETTRNTITGGMLALMQNPREREKLLADPSLIPLGVEEILRWVSPVAHMRRTLTQDAELRGVKLRAGEKIVMWYGSANRDEEVFEQPDVFNVTRQPNEHIAFGIGPHVCLGQRLAQLQLGIMFTELLRRFPDMEIAGDVKRLRSNFINGIKQMPVRFAPRRPV